MEREFKYYRDSFGQLQVKVNHMDLDFDVYEDHIDAQTDLHVTTLEEINSLVLNADDLQIHSIECTEHPLTYNYDKEQKLITLTFNDSIPKDTKVTIHSKSTCIPTANILEGVYYDETPKGCPCCMITQCQQWGFQRIVPCIDDMSAKCTYKTTIRGDKRYTNIISNGDPKTLMKDIGNDRVECVYDNTITPMATYLFFMGLGTYATFKKKFTYPNGKSFMMELLVPPNSDEEIANQALEILHDAIMWIHLFTGPDTYKNHKASTQIWRLMKEEKFAEAKELAKDLTLGYAYTGAVYREIAMQNSNFGGMENVGNTTITANRIMPFPHMGDNGFIYMMRVKAHEFYHNLNGSEVTGATPFEFWLNEAVTVFIEQKYSAFMHGEEFMRINEVQSIIAPQGGILALDRTPAAMPIEPVGFNTPDELVTSITYIKSPEVVRMVETIMGKEQFVKALDLYHTRFKHGNARSDQWFECMSEVSGIDFTHFIHCWIKQRGHPTVTVNASIEDKTLTLKLEQSEYEELHHHFPFTFVLYNKAGEQFYEDTIFVTTIEKEITVELTDEIGFYSLNPAMNSFIEVEFDQPDEAYYLQARHDKDLVNKNIALNKLFAKERVRLLEDKDAVLDKDLIDLYHSLVFNEEISSKVGIDAVAVFDFVSDKSYLHKYQDLYDVRERMFTSIAKAHTDDYLNKYLELKNKEYFGSVVEQRVAALHDRTIKNLCLGILSRLDTPEIQKLIKEQFLVSINASDKISAFSMYLKSSATDRLELVRSYEKEAKKNLVTWEAFLAGVARNEGDDAIDIIKEVAASPEFRIEQANDQRALFAVWASNKRKSLLTEEGRAYLKEIALTLAPVNEYNTLRAIDALDSLDYVDPEYQVPLVTLILEIIEELDKKENVTSVISYLKRTLNGSKKAINAYEEAIGPLPEL